MYRSLKSKKVGASMLLSGKELYDRMQQVLCSPNALKTI
jgi:hypothetical protein